MLADTFMEAIPLIFKPSGKPRAERVRHERGMLQQRSEEHTSELQSQ